METELVAILLDIGIANSGSVVGCGEFFVFPGPSGFFAEAVQASVAADDPGSSRVQFVMVMKQRVD